jgi:aspartate racemase
VRASGDEGDIVSGLDQSRPEVTTQPTGPQHCEFHNSGNVTRNPATREALWKLIKPLTLGLIGGLSLGAGIYYYRELEKASEAQGQPLSMLLTHADVRTVLAHIDAGEINELTAYLRDLIESLRLAGCDVAAISAVAPHICITQLAALSPLPIVSILEAIRDELERRQLRRVALFGHRHVIETDLYGALPGVDVVRPRPDETAAIARTYAAVVSRGGVSKDRALFRDIAEELCRRERLDAIVLAGTDLSILFESEEPGFPAIDCSQIHIRAITQRLA